MQGVTAHAGLYNRHMISEPYIRRRAALLTTIGEGVAVIPTAPERQRNRDTHFPYRFDSHFYYLTGFTEPEAVLVLLGGAEPKSILFCRSRDPEREIWDGFRHGPDAAKDRFGFDEAWPIVELDARMPDLLSDRATVLSPLGADAGWDARVIGWINAVRAKARAGIAAPVEISDVRNLVDEMRLIKDPAEIDTMRRAAAISGRAHVRAMTHARPGMAEFEVEAELIHQFRSEGAQAPAYPSIVAGGVNACVLHYVENASTLRDGELLLIDAGCELDGYASDITRTFPVNGRFTPQQRAVYELVLSAQRSAIAAVKAGARWNEPHDAAVKTLAQGFLDLGLLTGTLEEVLETEAYRRFYMHRTGHWLGLDVHDVGDYKRHGEWRTLEPGMVLTVEPGCYIAADAQVPAGFAGIGIRIEDDVLVTGADAEVLTGIAPKSPDDIEALMRNR